MPHSTSSQGSVNDLVGRMSKRSLKRWETCRVRTAPKAPRVAFSLLPFASPNASDNLAWRKGGNGTMRPGPIKMVGWADVDDSFTETSSISSYLAVVINIGLSHR